MGSTLSNARRARTAVVAIWIMLACSIFMFLAAFKFYDMLRWMQMHMGAVHKTADTTINTLRFAAILNFSSYAGAGIAFVMWFRRAYGNLHRKVLNLEFDPAWAMGAWVVPILNLYRPYDIMKEMFESADALLSERQEEYEGTLSVFLVRGWWALFLVVNFVSVIGYYLLPDPETIPQLMSRAYMVMISSFLNLPLGVLTMKLVKDYSAIEPMIEELPDAAQDESADPSGAVPVESTAPPESR